MTAPSPPPRIGPRTEWKFRLAPSAATGVFEAARATMRPDPHARSESCDYDVDSIYLDTSDLRCFRRGGVGDAAKYRIRRYGGDGRVIFLEEKLRRGHSVWKRRVEIGVDELGGFFEDSDPSHGRGWYRARVRLLQLRPALRISYRRRALIGPGGERLTVDSRLRAAPLASARLAFETAGSAQPLGPADVLEIKFEGPPTALVLALRGLAAAKPGPHSKYRLGVHALGPDVLVGATR